MKKIVLGMLFLLTINLTGCNKEETYEYDPFGSTAEERAKSKTPASSTQQSSTKKQLFLDAPTEIEATADKKITIDGTTLPGAEVTLGEDKVTADSEGKFSFTQDFISISDKEYQIATSLGSERQTSTIIVKPNQAYMENLKKESEEKQHAVTAIPAEYLSALNKARSYVDMMDMSKAGLYEQLTSEYGEKFSPEAAQYAVDNLQVDYNAKALAKAKTYQEQMSMSPEAIREQLVSEHGEKFTPEEAEYAIQNLNN